MFFSFDKGVLISLAYTLQYVSSIPLPVSRRGPRESANGPVVSLAKTQTSAPFRVNETMRSLSPSCSNDITHRDCSMASDPKELLA